MSAKKTTQGILVCKVPFAAAKPRRSPKDTSPASEIRAGVKKEGP
jgi:hypothetical protein